MSVRVLFAGEVATVCAWIEQGGTGVGVAVGVAVGVGVGLGVGVAVGGAYGPLNAQLQTSQKATKWGRGRA
jgi:hypothetical protein